ncbi:MAG: DNA polymerase III subunit alpha, partial [Firmicutes bacterium]|nr:DNA polymerase III subunit alpha [Bacillota bacterium]
EGYYYKPRIDLELLKEYHEGIIAGSACLAGPVSRAILAGSYEKAKDLALEYNKIFGQGNFFLELQNHGMPEQKIVNEQLIKISRETGIPLIATNDSHYIYKEDDVPHDILLCIQTGKTVEDEDRMKYDGGQFYFKSGEEMASLFSYVPEALENTARIAERCNVEFKFHDLKLPKYDVPDNLTANEYLRKLCYEGFAKHYPDADDELKERLEYELSTIEKMGYVDYFLIVWDYINYAKTHDIIVGPGRGSAAGSIVSYCLSITTIDPIKYSLIFERFLNPERVSMPDIDVDFCFENRQKVIDYVNEKYGENRVAQIITFGTLAARAAIKDVGRALAMPYADVDKVSKMIPMELGITIDKALERNPELKELYDNDEASKHLVDMSRRLEGLPRHASTHAAGVVICREPVMEYVPLYSNDGLISTQFTMGTLEELGILKMDFLGLRTLTVIQNAVKEIKRIHGIDIDIDNIDQDDKNVYGMIAQGKTEGVFQLESAGMKSFMKELQPTCLEDLIAGISLYRPGPMDFIPKYVKGKNDKDNVVYTHPALKSILEPTYGCIVYQEQVMQIVRDLAGYSLGRSDLVRRAMSKKKASVMAEERKNFVYGTDDGTVPGCVKNGISADVAEKIFDEMTDFAKYAFNKSHAACYAVVGYQTAWLKYHYPVEFMAALMTSVMENGSKVTEYIEECKKMGIELLPPDINEGYSGFSVSKGKIRFGLAAIKAVGDGVIKAIVKEREESGPFTSLTGFLSRMEGKEINKRCIESFIKAGVFDSFGSKRSQYMSCYKAIIDGIGQSRKNNLEGQMNLFDLGGDDSAEERDDFPDMNEYDRKDLLAMEKEVLGIYVSGHPLADYEDVLNRKVSCTSRDFFEDSDESYEKRVMDGDKVKFGGLIADKKIKYTKNNKIMAFLRIEDIYGTVETVVFPATYTKYQNMLQEDAVVLVTGRADIPDDAEGKIIAEDFALIGEETEEKEYSVMYLRVKDMDELNSVIPMLKSCGGKIPVKIRVSSTGKMLMAPNDCMAVCDENFVERLKKLIGEENVVLK